MEAENMYYEFTISQIDNKYMKIIEFNNETLFMNIYHYSCFVHFLSPYYSWGDKAIKNLKMNMLQKWPRKDFSNVNLFLELLLSRTKEVDPAKYLFQSEDYFTLLMSLKPVMDEMVCDRHLSLNLNFIKSKRKCIR